jgi:hypothetical protein
LSDKTTAEAPGRQAGLSVAEAAAAIGLSKITVLRRMRSGAWPGGRCGAKWLVSQPFVDALVIALTTSAQVNVEVFAAEWMTRSESGAPAGAVA